VVFGGLGGAMFLDELRRGAAGTMTGFAFPEILVDIHRKFGAGDVEGARDAFERVCPLIQFENQPRINLAIRKHVYRLRGAITCDRMRQPAPRLDEGTAQALESLLTRLGLMEVDPT
jgi:4-hydroxy-tetrahydrodipicolinate synthase